MGEKREIGNPEAMLRKDAAPVPRGADRFRWYGPGILWMLSAVGTGSILFTPRVGSVYEYQLFWLLMLVVFFMWVMIKEMGRFSILTGRTMLDGMSRLPGPRNWAVWIIFIPQLFAAAVGIAGLAAIVGSAFAVTLPGPGSWYAIGTVLFSVWVTTGGRYMLVENISKVMSLILMVTAIFSAAVVFPADPAPLLDGLVPSLPETIDLYVVLPWVGTILAGSMGIIWFSYWVATRGYGGGFEKAGSDREVPEEAKEEHRKPLYRGTGDKERRIRGWLKLVDATAAVGVIGGLVILVSFLVQGSQLLAPQGLLPSGRDVALDLSRLFSDVWGDSGTYLILLAIVIALGGSVLANQDGWGRSFADMTLIVSDHPRLHRYGPRGLKKFFILTVTGIIPVGILLLFSDPVAIMSASGIIAAAHTPFIVFTALYVNRRLLPPRFRPGFFYTGTMALSGLFYLGFAVLYLL